MVYGLPCWAAQEPLLFPFGVPCEIPGEGDELGSKFGYMDLRGHMRIKPAFDYASHFSMGLACVRKGGQFGYIDATGAMVIGPLSYDHCSIFLPSGLAMVRVAGKEGFIDLGGGEVVKPQYVAARFPVSTPIAVYVGGRLVSCEGEPQLHGGNRGYIDASGKTVLAPKFDDAYAFRAGRARVCVDGRWGYIDTSGQLISPLKWTCAGEFCDEGLAIVADSGDRWYCLNAKGEAVFSLDCEDCDDFAEGRARVKRGGKYGYVDTRGRLVVPTRFQQAGHYSEGLAPVLVGGSWGYVDTDGRMAIEPRFGCAEPFSEGLANVRVDWHWGYIDKTGAMAIPAKLPYSATFHRGLAQIPNSFWYIDTKGRVLPNDETVTRRK